MANRPSFVPTYATDANLTGGPQVGQATRLKPTDALRGQGFYKDRRIAARILSWVLGTIGDWLGFLANVQVANWQLQALDFLGTTTNHSGIAWIPGIVPGTGASAGKWLLFASTPAPVTVSIFFPCIGADIPNAAGPPLDEWHECCASTGGGIIVAAGVKTGAGKTYASNDRGLSWTAGGAVTSVADNKLCFSAVSGLFVTEGVTTGHIATSPNGTVWTDRGLPTGVVNSYFFIKAFANGVLLAVDDGTRLTHSNDGGITWSAVSAVPIANVFDATWCEAFGYCLVGPSGVSVSPDLVTWTTYLAPFGTSSCLSLTSDGKGCFAVATNGAQNGVFFSTDGGVTWPFVALTAYETTPTNYKPHKLLYNGSQWALFSVPTGATSKYSFHTTIATP